jgi:hypothetical protein
MNVQQTRRPHAGGFFIARACGIILAAAALAGTPACDERRPAEPVKETMPPARSISDVLKEHAPRLMALGGVAGVYEGALPDGKPCIVVMLKSERPAERKDIPELLEGYPVRLEFGGEIRPMR